MMGRRTFVYIDGVAYERGVDEIPETNDIRSQVGEGVLWGDRHYDGLRATDGTDISTRTKQREYMRQHGLTTADDFKGQWASAAKERADIHTTGGDHAARRADVARAAHMVYEMSKRRK
jgi:hypothetical protein